MKKFLGLCAGLIIGGIGGYAFYHVQYVGTGACPVPGSPWTNPYFLTIGGAVIGMIMVEAMADMFRKRRRF